MDDQASLPPPRLPFKPSHRPATQGAVERLRPGSDPTLIRPLAVIWDEVLHRIIDRAMTLAAEDAPPLHINVREDMIWELATLQLWLADRIVEKRLGNRALEDIGPDAERSHCLGASGEGAVMETARLVHEQIWTKRMEERWKPKSEKATEREANPREAKLAIKAVGKNHFVPRWFIRDHWAVDGNVMRWRRTGSTWNGGLRGFGRWGYGHKLYSDRLEAYMALLEGDAKQPIEMLLDTRPLNGPQRLSFVGFLIIQILRNPSFADGLREQIIPVIAELGYGDNPEMAAKAYETLFSNNGLFHQLAHPVMWSRWALMQSPTPVFVLPDTFGAHAELGDGLRMVVPLTPNLCFVTLPGREEEKRAVPYWLTVNEVLAMRISNALIGSAAQEFLSHPDFAPDSAPETIRLADLLRELEAAVDLKDQQAEREALRA